MIVKYRLIQTSQPIIITDCINTYQKGDFYCVLTLINGVKSVRKIPIRLIFDIVEDY